MTQEELTRHNAKVKNWRTFLPMAWSIVVAIVGAAVALQNGADIETVLGHNADAWGPAIPAVYTVLKVIGDRLPARAAKLILRYPTLPGYVTDVIGGIIDDPPRDAVGNDVHEDPPRAIGGQSPDRYAASPLAPRAEQPVDMNDAGLLADQHLMPATPTDEDGLWQAAMGEVSVMNDRDWLDTLDELRRNEVSAEGDNWPEDDDYDHEGDA